MIDKSKNPNNNSSKKPIKNKLGKLDFAASMQELEDITAYLQSDNVDINSAIEKFKRGQQLATELKAFLEETENTIAQIKLSAKK